MRILTLILVSVFLTSCNGQTSTVKDPTTSLKRGRLTYTIWGKTTPNWEFEVLFDQQNAVLIEKFAFGANNKFVFDKKTNEVLELIDQVVIMGDTKGRYFIYKTPQEIAREKMWSNFGDTILTETNEYKEILGFKCQKIVLQLGGQAEVEAWLTDKIKPGFIYPWTPLSFERLALEYELKVMGKTERKYVIKLISDEKIKGSEFEHKIPDNYYLLVPAYIYPFDTTASDTIPETRFQSFSYPYYGDGDSSTIDFLKKSIQHYVVENNIPTPVFIEFFVNKDGTISDSEVYIVNLSKQDSLNQKLKTYIEKMPKWTPARVRGRAVKSRVSLKI